MSGSGNEADLGHIISMLGNVITAQQEMRAELRDHGGKLDALDAGLREVRADIADVRGDIAEVRTEVSGLRQALIEYHSAVIGHGVLISELEARLRRVEQHLNLPPAA